MEVIHRSPRLPMTPTVRQLRVPTGVSREFGCRGPGAARRRRLCMRRVEVVDTSTGAPGSAPVLT